MGGGKQGKSEAQGKARRGAWGARGDGQSGCWGSMVEGLKVKRVEGLGFGPTGLQNSLGRYPGPALAGLAPTQAVMGRAFSLF